MECPTIRLAQIVSGQMASERIYFDQASILVPLGLLCSGQTLPSPDVASARGPLDDQLPSNELMKRTLSDKDL